VYLHTFDEWICMTERVGVSHNLKYNYLLVEVCNYWNKFCLHTKLDVVNPIIKVFWLLIAWKFARMKIYCNFQSVIIIFLLKKVWELNIFLVDISEYVKQNGLPQLVICLTQNGKTFWVLANGELLQWRHCIYYWKHNFMFLYSYL